MDEFIVWDEGKKTFSNSVTLKDIKAYDGEVRSIWLDDGGDGVEIGDDLGWGIEKGAEKIQEKLTFHRLIKIDDTPEQNKIYDDCSIVEFKHCEKDTYLGYFSYNIEKYGYEIILLNSYLDKFENIELSSISDLKVIGTLQQDKGLLHGS